VTTFSSVAWSVTSNGAMSGSNSETPSSSNARADPGEGDPARAQVIEDASLGVGLALAPLVHELDPKPAIRDAFDRTRVRLELRGRLVGVRKPQDANLADGATPLCR
jgi:hypothetical protein